MFEPSENCMVRGGVRDRLMEQQLLQTSQCRFEAEEEGGQQKRQLECFCRFRWDSKISKNLANILRWAPYRPHDSVDGEKNASHLLF